MGTAMHTDRDIMEDCNLITMTTNGYSTERDITRYESVVLEEECEKEIGTQIGTQIGTWGPSRRTPSGAK